MTLREALPVDRFIDLHVRQRLSCGAIARLFGVSRQRVHQLKRLYEADCGPLLPAPRFDVFTLKRLLDEGKTYAEIARELVCSPSCVARAVGSSPFFQTDSGGFFVLKKQRISDRLPKSRLLYLYAACWHTDAEIAQLMHVSVSSVRALRRTWHIPAHYGKPYRQLRTALPRERMVFFLQVRRWTLDQLAAHFDCPPEALRRLQTEYSVSFHESL